MSPRLGSFHFASAARSQIEVRESWVFDGRRTWWQTLLRTVHFQIQNSISKRRIDTTFQGFDKSRRRLVFKISKRSCKSLSHGCNHRNCYETNRTEVRHSNTNPELALGWGRRRAAALLACYVTVTNGKAVRNRALAAWTLDIQVLLNRTINDYIGISIESTWNLRLNSVTKWVSLCGISFNMVDCSHLN